MFDDVHINQVAIVAIDSDLEEQSDMRDEGIQHVDQAQTFNSERVILEDLTNGQKVG